MTFEQLRELRNLLTHCRWVARQLEIVITRQTKSAPMGEGIGKSTEQPLVFSERASTAHWTLRRTLLKYALPARSCSCTPPGAPCALEPLPGLTDNLAAWMVERVMKFQGEDSMLADVRAAYTEAVEAIDRPPTRIYLGDCVCETKLYGDPEADELSCPGCDLIHNPVMLRLANQERGKNLLVTAADAARYVGDVYGIQLTAKRIRVWSARGKLERYEGDELKYRLGDVIELAAKMAGCTN